MLKRKRLGREIRSRGMKGNIRSIYSTEYNLSLFELLKSYSSIIMTKDFQKMTSIELLKREAMVIMIPKIYGIVLDWAQVL